MSDESPSLAGVRDLDIAGFEITSKLGEGAHGEVFKARKESTGQLVAIKTMRRRHDESPDQLARRLERFRREMRLCAELSHPHIVRLVESGQTGDGALYAAFEYVAGETLLDLLRSNEPLPPGESLHVMSQVLDALTCAHRRGIVHRDLKPANIMVTRTGARRNAHVLDFGVGAFVRDRQAVETQLTMTREALGTPAYAAPEQLRGHSVDGRADLYAWGLVVLECVTGRRVISGASLEEVLQLQLGEDPIPIPPEITHPDLRRVLQAVTAKNPDDRVIEVDEILSALELAQTSEAHDRFDSALATQNIQLDPFAQATEERRQVTVLSCRIESTGGRAGDGEEADRLLRVHQVAAADVAGRLGGHLAGIVGSRIVVLFGYPHAGEDAPQRATQAAMEIVEEIQHNPPVQHEGMTVRVHLGLHTGSVTTPAARSKNDSVPVSGTTVDGAMHLDSLASPGEVLVSQTCEQALRGLASLEPAPDKQLLSMGRPSDVFRVRRAPTEASIAQHVPATPLVSRSDELARLQLGWTEAAAGVPQMALVRGEAGVGKTRLLRELRRAVDDSAWFECRCSPSDSQSPLRPVIQLIGRVIDAGGMEEVLTARDFDLATALPLFSALLDRPIPDGYALPELGPERLKELTLDHLLALFLRTAEAQPLCFVVEDLQWADPTTLDFLSHLVEEISSAQVSAHDSEAKLNLCALFTARPEFRSEWSQSGLSTIEVSRLSPSDASALVDACLDGIPGIRESDRREVLRRADGIPLFIEEVARMVRDTDPSEVTTSSSALRIPPTLQDLLAARLGDLSPSARETAQLASALGREFTETALAASSPRTPSELRRDLDGLIAAGLVYRRRSSLEPLYLFKHELVRQSAYDSMVAVTRQRVHETIARSLVKKLPDQAKSQPEVVAHHWEWAGNPANAAREYQAAARSAVARYANREAASHLQNAIRLMAELPETPERDQTELEAQLGLGRVLLETEGWAAREVEEAFSRARQLVDESAEPERQFKVFNGLWGFYLVRSDRRLAEEMAESQHRTALEANDEGLRIAGLNALGTTSFFAGDQRIAAARLSEAMSLMDDFLLRADRRAQRRTVRLASGLPSYMAWCHTLSGRARSATDLIESTIDRARQSGDPFLLAEALNHGLAVWHDLDEVDRTRAICEEVIPLATTLGFKSWRAVAESTRGWARVAQGEIEEGLAEIASGLDSYLATGARNPKAYRVSHWIDALRIAGRIEQALKEVDVCIDEVAADLDRFWDAELFRLKGELLMEAGRLGEAEKPLHAALELARSQGAGWLELRAALSQARLAKAAGEAGGPEALERLRGCLDRVPEAADTRCAREAVHLLEESAKAGA